MKMIINYGTAGKGRSYSPFIVKHNLMGKTDEELRKG